MKSKYTSTHQFNSVLTRITLSLAVLKMKADDKSSYEKIEKDLKILQRRIKNILDYHALKDEDVEVNIDKVKLSDILYKLTKQGTNLMELKTNIIIRTDFQLLSELVGNILNWREYRVIDIHTQDDSIVILFQQKSTNDKNLELLDKDQEIENAIRLENIKRLTRILKSKIEITDTYIKLEIANIP